MIKFLLIVFSIFSLSAQTMRSPMDRKKDIIRDFNFNNYVVSDIQNDSLRVLSYVSIPNASLQFLKENDKFISNYEMTITLKKNYEYERDDLIRAFINLQYKRNDQNFFRGTFRVRGENLEIFPSHLEDRAWRISFNLNKLEKIEEFDPLTGDKTNDYSIIKIYANSHYITPKPTIEQAIRQIKSELAETLKKHRENNKLLEEQRLRERTKFDLETVSYTHLTLPTT